MPATANLAIVGGGMLGMALAKRLTAAGHRVTLFESGGASGGLASADPIGPFVWDRFYHVILSSDRELLDLVDELGLSDRLRWQRSRTGFFVGDELVPLTTVVDFLRFPPINLIDKARLAATILWASRIRDGRALESVPVSEWLVRWSGQRVFDRLWLPLLKAKLGDNYRTASASFIWAIIARMYAARRSGLKQELFGYVVGGYAAILDRLRQSLASSGVTTRTGADVVEVAEVDGGVSIRTATGSTETFDRAILTVGCQSVAAICPQLSAPERIRLSGVEYQGVICTSVLLRRPLGGYYITNLADSRLAITAIIEMTALVDPATFGGMSLVYLPWYLPAADPRWSLDDDAIVARSVRDLTLVYPNLTADDIVSVRVARARQVLALSTLEYSERSLPATTTSLPRVHLVNSAQIVNGTLNVNETLMLARQKAAELLPTLAGTAATPLASTR